MQAMFRKEDKFKKRLKNVLESENLEQQRDLISRITAELDLNIEDCAAALVYLTQSNLYQSVKKVEQVSDFNNDFEIPRTVTQNKTVHYRLEVGGKHQVKQEEIKNVLVEVSGVDKKRIGRIDIRHHYTLVELPDCMPGDIFQLLTEVKIRQQKLNIKRLKPQRKFRRYHKQAQ